MGIILYIPPVPRRFAPAAVLLALVAMLGSLFAQEESATDPVARSDGGPWMQVHEEHLRRLAPGIAELIFVGDSITQGWEGGGREVWDRYYAPRRAVNLGIGGDRTQHVLWRLEHGALRGISPKVAVVMIGTNNITANPPEEVADGISAIVRTIRAKLPRTKVLLLGIFPRKNPGGARERIAAINDRIKALGDDKAVNYLDISKTFLEADGTISREIMPDYLHLSPKGYRLWAEAMEPKLWEMMVGK